LSFETLFKECPRALASAAAAASPKVTVSTPPTSPRSCAFFT
jgi:hypothetical protein